MRMCLVFARECRGAEVHHVWTSDTADRRVKFYVTPHSLQEIVEVVRVVPRERVQQQAAEQSVPQPREERVEAVRLIPCERVQKHAAEHLVDEAIFWKNLWTERGQRSGRGLKPRPEFAEHSVADSRCLCRERQNCPSRTNFGEDIWTVRGYRSGRGLKPIPDFAAHGGADCRCVCRGGQNCPSRTKFGEEIWTVRGYGSDRVQWSRFSMTLYVRFHTLWIRVSRLTMLCFRNESQRGLGEQHVVVDVQKNLKLRSHSGADAWWLWKEREKLTDKGQLTSTGSGSQTSEPVDFIPLVSKFFST